MGQNIAAHEQNLDLPEQCRNRTAWLNGRLVLGFLLLDGSFDLSSDLLRRLHRLGFGYPEGQVGADAGLALDPGKVVLDLFSRHFVVFRSEQKCRGGYAGRNGAGREPRVMQHFVQGGSEFCDAKEVEVRQRSEGMR